MKSWVAALTLVTLGALSAPACAAPDYSLADVKACSRDAMRLCRDKLPDLDAIEGCMRAHFEELRPACKERFNR